MSDDSEPPATYDDLSAVYINCTLKPSPQTSHTQALIDRSAAVMEHAGVSVTHVRPVDHQIAFGVYPDMTEHGADVDEWPPIQQSIMDADILVIGTPIWLGEKSSVSTMVVERLYGFSSELNDEQQYAYYGRVGGCLVTGNEDGVKHCALSILYALQHIGYTIPPQADAGWIGAVGPGPSYGDDPEEGDVPVGFDSDFTNRNTTFMAWNLIHMARMLKDNGGIPAYGNQSPKWSEGARWGHPG